MGAWNARSGRVWNRFMTALKRAYPGLEYWDGVEPQDGKRRADGQGRMGLHRHAALSLPVGVVLDPFVVQHLAVRSGYGCSVDVEEIRSADVASYVAKRVASYVTKGIDDRARVPWEVADPHTGHLVARRASYQRYSQSVGWGPSASAIGRSIRDAHRARVAAARVPPSVEELAETDAVLVDVFARPPPPADPDALALALLARWRTPQGIVGRLPAPREPHPADA